MKAGDDLYKSKSNKHIVQSFEISSNS
jgi:hypothetical protein